MISPYAKRDHVSHVLYDHTSMLAMVERNWNLPALTYRDADANDLMDFIDVRAMQRRNPTFPQLPRAWPRRGTRPLPRPAPVVGLAPSRRRAPSAADGPRSP